MTTRLFRRLSPLAGCLFSVCGWAADTVPNQPAVRVFTSPWARLFSGSESSFSTALTYNSDLARHPVYVPTGRDASEIHDKYNQRLLLSMQYSPMSYFFANMTVRVPLQDTNKYSTDFVYSFGYDDWHPGTFSLVYGNYSEDNHFYPASGARHTYFERGAWTFAYKFSLPGSLEKHLLINKEDALICQVGYSYVPRYYSLADSGIKRNKSSLLASCGYTLLQHYFLRVSSFYYPDSRQQQPWDYDYTYSIGYVSSYLPGAVSVHYDNYSGTRYPWRSDANANFRRGTINLSWTLPF
ncbi:MULTISPECIES: hypothetical protein [Serratia]|uniref:hypothetical protein n=1 Tax=Serratia TaxID=613 RepID=UPI000AD36CD3|nr:MULTISPECIES: hypothetical protein [Serratia]MCH6191870.1 hypothetical protein [Serratia sp. X10]MDI3198526.1 hypothetical protein [Serratia ureilytica]MDM1841645.1 hypothetical protein [Serratia ureilytica]UUW20590.1 hypothetical protein NAL25_12145 [Serratia ureilytica]CAI0841863.1 Uncharacterised protein [Serratia marcescens]